MAFDKAAFADKVRRTKEHLALADAELAEGTGIPVQRLSILLSGQTDPTGDEVLILSDYFDCDYKFFISNEKLAAFEETDSLYRKHGDAFSKADRRSIQQFLYLCECESWLWHRKGNLAPKFSFAPRGQFFKAHGERAARELRKHLGYSSGQIPSDLFRDLRRIGIHVFRRKLANSNISGVMIRHPEAGACVLVNYVEDVYRQRFTAAHELAHVLMEDASVNVSFGNDGSNLVEVRANTFASNYLLPQDFVKQTLSKTQKWTAQELLSWASRLKVSADVLRISLKENELIDETAFRELSDSRVPQNLKVDPELANESGKTRERKAALLEKGLSFHYVSECLEALSNGHVSNGRAAEMMLISESELPELKKLFSVDSVQ